MQSFNYFRRKYRLFLWPWVGKDFLTKALKGQTTKGKDWKLGLNYNKDLLFIQRLQIKWKDKSQTEGRY